MRPPLTSLLKNSGQLRTRLGMLRTRTGRAAGLGMAFAVVLGLALTAAADDDRPLMGQADEAVSGVEPTPDGLRFTVDGAG